MAAMTNKNHEDGFGMDVLWPPPDKGDQESDVDIVFVHGLNGKRRATWTKGDVFWPRDLLAQDFPTARIMTWGYDARVMQFFGPVGQGSIHDHAHELNEDLRQERAESHQIFRPLIFFAHSLGGLVVKNALFRSYLAGVGGAQVTDHCAAIEKSTAGVIFAGTPHRGSDQTKWARSATNMAKVVQKDHSSKMLQSLERGNQTLEQLADYFKNIQYNFNIFTFTEELPCPKIGRIVEPDSAVMNCEHEKTRMIHANHMEMVRHDDRGSNEYKKMKDAFQQVHHQLTRQGLQQTRQRAASFNGFRNSYIQVPEEYLPRNNIQPGATEQFYRNSIQQGPANAQQQPAQQRTIELGRVNTVATDYLAPAARRTAAVEASPRTFYQNHSNRASTTTIGTVGSASSRGSDQSLHRIGERQPSSTPHIEHRSSRGSEQSLPRLDEQPHHQHQSSSPPSTPQPEYLTHLRHGTRLVRLRGRDFAQNLPLAHAHFTSAISLLGPPSTPNLKVEQAKIKYQLMNLEFESAFNRSLSPQEKLAALSRAEQWGWEARDAASSPSTPSTTDPPKSAAADGLLAQITLYLSILRGRTTEVSSRLGVPPAETTQQKETAVNAILAALVQIRESCPGKLSESEKFARTWVERLGGTWPQNESEGSRRDSVGSGAGGAAGATTPGVVTTPPTSELGTNTNTISTSTSPRAATSTIPAPPVVAPAPTAPLTSATGFPPAAELDSAPPPRASMADMSYFAELDISGQMVQARYLNRETSTAIRPVSQHSQSYPSQAQRASQSQAQSPQQQQQQRSSLEPPQPQRPQLQERQSLYSTYNYDPNSDRDPGLGVSLGLGGPSRFSIAEDYGSSPDEKKKNSPPPQSPPVVDQKIPLEYQAYQPHSPPAQTTQTTALYSHPPDAKFSPPPPQHQPQPQPQHQIPPDDTNTNPNDEPPPAYSPYLS